MPETRFIVQTFQAVKQTFFVSKRNNPHGVAGTSAFPSTTINGLEFSSFSFIRADITSVTRRKSLSDNNALRESEQKKERKKNGGSFQILLRG